MRALTIIALTLAVLGAFLPQPILAALESDPQDPPIWDLLTSIPKEETSTSAEEQALAAVFRELHEGSDSVAEQIVVELLKKQPENALALEVMGTIQLNRRRLKEAEVFLQRAVDAAPERASALGKLGAVRMGLGLIRQGEAHLHQALAVDPEQVFVLRTLARLETTRRNLGVAIELYQRLLKTPDMQGVGFSSYHIELGELLLSSGDNAGTLALVEPALSELNSGALKNGAMRLAISAYLSANNVDAAKQLTDELLAASEPHSVDATLIAAAVLRAANDDEGAIALLRQASEANNQAALHQALGQIYLARKDFVAATGAFKAAVTVAPSAQSALQLVRFHNHAAFDGGSKVTALKVAVETAKRYPDSAELGVLVATTRAAAGEPAGALKDFEQLQRKFPKAGDIYVQQAQLLLQRNRKNEAISLLEKGIKLVPERWDLWALLAELQSSPQAARGVLERGLKHHPTSPDLRYDLAAIGEASMSVEQAIGAYQTILQDSPGHAATLIRLAGLMAPNPSTLAKAEAMLSQARALAGNTLAVISADAWLRHHAGQSGDALRRLKAIGKQVKHPETLYRIAVIHAAAGRKKPAGKSARAALKAGLAGVEQIHARQLAK